jgi:hypothetical protein
MKSDTPPPDIPQGDIQEALEGLRRYLRGCRAMLAVEKCCSADLITPDDAETHLQAVQRWVEERENRTRADEWSDMAISLQEKYAEIATLREENERMRTEGVSLSNQRELAVAETVKLKAEINVWKADHIRRKEEIARLREALGAARDTFDMIANPLQAEHVVQKDYKIRAERARDRIDALSPEKSKGGMEQRESDYYAGTEAGIDAAQILIPPEEHEALKRERDTYRGALEAARHDLARLFCTSEDLTADQVEGLTEQALHTIATALSPNKPKGDPGEVPAPSEPSEKPCGTCGGSKLTFFKDGDYADLTRFMNCLDCTPGKEGG